MNLSVSFWSFSLRLLYSGSHLSAHIMGISTKARKLTLLGGEKQQEGKCTL